MSVELFQSAFVSVVDAAYLCMPFIFSANPDSSVRGGQASAKPS